MRIDQPLMLHQGLVGPVGRVISALGHWIEVEIGDLQHRCGFGFAAGLTAHDVLELLSGQRPVVGRIGAVERHALRFQDPRIGHQIAVLGFAGSLEEDAQLAVLAAGVFGGALDQDAIRGLAHEPELILIPVTIASDVAGTVDDRGNPNDRQGEQHPLQVTQKLVGSLRLLQPAEVATPAPDCPGVQGVAYAVLLAKGLVATVEFIDVFLIDEDPAKGEIIHLVPALLFWLSVWLSAAAVIEVEVDFAVCHGQAFIVRTAWLKNRNLHSYLIARWAGRFGAS
ncbi:hypothetical protein BQ8482_130140 [Mesorhizobium delmotii]|uniref:Uncharacterized protein n=1 Tax=Mesorhizobium delmotii TaxID=1631247 RepID=A0A2P9AGH6_9HYPH|nr:hypothetical protein BQ8482_130140 [Mesorhizobium delmotii]